MSQTLAFLCRKVKTSIPTGVLNAAKLSNLSNHVQADARRPRLCLRAQLKDSCIIKVNKNTSAGGLLRKIILNTSPQPLLFRVTQERAGKETADTKSNLTGRFTSIRRQEICDTHLRRPRAVFVLHSHTPRGPPEVWNYSSEELNQF